MSVIAVCLSVILLSPLAILTRAMNSSRGGGCVYTFQVWTPNDDVLSRLQRLERHNDNVTFQITHEQALFRNRILLEILDMRNSSQRLERTVLELRTDAVMQRDSNRMVALQMEDLKAHNRKIWSALSELHELADNSQGVATEGDDDHVTAADFEEEMRKTETLVQQLKNGIGDLKGEWLLIKRQVQELQIDYGQEGHDYDQIHTDAATLKDQLGRLRQEVDEHIHSGHIPRGSNTAGATVRDRYNSVEQHELAARLGHLDTVTTKLDDEVVFLRERLINLTRGLMMNLTSSPNATAEFMYSLLNPEPRPQPLVTLPQDCQDIYASGFRSSGEYDILPRGAAQTNQVYCRLVNGSGWTMFQRRIDGSLNFRRHWLEYKYGFGSIFGEFWMGNEWLHLMTRQKRYRLRVEMWDWEGRRSFMEYAPFDVDNEVKNYRLSVGVYSGNAGDSLSFHDGMAFSTHDMDNDLSSSNCAAEYQSGWWFRDCLSSNLNGVYHPGYYSEDTPHDGIVWYTLKESVYYSLRKVELMIKPYM